MIEFDINFKNIKLRIICDKEKMNLIKILMNGHSYLSETTGIPTYTLILKNDIKTAPGKYIKMIDKWYDNATCDVWIDNTSKIIYMANIDASNTKWKNMLIQYFTCNLFNRLIEEIGYIAFHSSCVTKNNKGIAFIAPRNSGKTNCMLNLMNEGYNSVANDKLAIQYDGKSINGYGVAQDVSIRMSAAFTKQKQNKKYVDYAIKNNIRFNKENLLESNNIHLNSNELAKMNNVRQVPETNINYIFFPEYDSSIKNVKLQLLNLKEILKRLKSEELPLVHETTNFFKEIKTKKDIFNTEDTYKNICELESYKIIQGENTKDSFIKVIKKIVN